jgi:spore germination protein KC
MPWSLSKSITPILSAVGDTLHRRHPVKWDKIKDKWDEIFPEIQYDIQIESHVLRTYDIREPNTHKEEKED